jgi:hypothetical protein
MMLMSHKKLSAVIAISTVLVMIVAEAQIASIVSGNPVGYLDISVISPETKTYNTNSVPLIFTFEEPEEASWMGYSLDNQQFVTVSGNITLSGLTDGDHSIRVYANNSFYMRWDSEIVNFIVQTDITPPVIGVLSPENAAYNVTSPPLNFTVDEPVSWIAYSLDNQANTTIDGNTTLSGLTEGLHSVTLFANDTFGNMGTSETVNFTVMPSATPTPEPEQQALSTTTIAIAASGIFIAVAGLGSLVYFKKRKY